MPALLAIAVTVANNMKKHIQNRKVLLRFGYLGSFLLISLYSCIMQKPYSAKITKFQPSFWGEIKENNLKRIADTTEILITGKVYDYDRPEGGISVIFISKENKRKFKTVTDSKGHFQINIVNGLYNIQLIPYKYGKTPSLNFENLNFKSGEIRELIIYTESSAETVSMDTIFESKRAYNEYLKRQ
ncbi:hypothetical protein SAMN05421766_11151 [Zobellia uliginosa]|uniref:CarboxypepD_reg-like domain-containing protein n=2 Tax=Zobellia uliginosa TaxID=143224 RepID=A0ABY1L1Q0_9FLAO|nr:hypothetical protein SAMN05421766_11151 [Zobellia uliginosa]